MEVLNDGDVQCESQAVDVRRHRWENVVDDPNVEAVLVVKALQSARDEGIFQRQGRGD